MRIYKFIWITFFLCGFVTAAALADTFRLTDGRTIDGDVISASSNEEGVQMRLADGRYERIPWSSFSQDDLRKFNEDRRMAQFAEPFIEISLEERVRRTEVAIQEPPRLEKPARKSLLAAMLSSGPGLVMLLMVYGANIYAAYEIAIFRARPVPLVCGLAAAAPIVAPVIFLSMPTRLNNTEDTVPEGAAAPPAGGAAAPMAGSEAAPQGHGPETPEAEHAPAAAARPALPEAQVFQRGAFTFNRRFFETRFPRFFGIHRPDTEKDLVLQVKASRGTYVAQQITRISASEMHLHVQKGSASEEVMVPFSEVQEIQLKHKDA